MSHMLVAIATPMAAESLFVPLSDLARRLGSEITLLHVLTAGGGHPSASLERGRQSVDDLAARLIDAGLRCTTRHIEGVEDVAGTILQTAGEVGATLIAMGIDGKSSFARRTGGSIPGRVLSRTALPVLLLPPAPDLVL